MREGRTSYLRHAAHCIRCAFHTSCSSPACLQHTLPAHHLPHTSPTCLLTPHTPHTCPCLPAFPRWCSHVSLSSALLISLLYLFSCYACSMFGRSVTWHGMACMHKLALLPPSLSLSPYLQTFPPSSYHLNIPFRLLYSLVILDRDLPTMHLPTYSLDNNVSLYLLSFCTSLSLLMYILGKRKRKEERKEKK